MNNFITRTGLFLITILFITTSSLAQKDNLQLKGEIQNYTDKEVKVYQCYLDSLTLINSTNTNSKGSFSLLLPNLPYGIIRVELEEHQFFYLLNNNEPIEIKTQFISNADRNYAADSLVVVQSDENKNLVTFQILQREINVADYWLLQLLRVYPPADSYYKDIEREYFSRFKNMTGFIDKLSIPKKKNETPSVSKLLATAFYPHNPDWRQSDLKRDSIIAAHYFEYFDPSHAFYLHSNILPEKLEGYLRLKAIKRNQQGQPIPDEVKLANAAKEFIDKTTGNHETFKAILDYTLKKFDKEHKEDAFINLYDAYLKPSGEDCGNSMENLSEEEGALSIQNHLLKWKEKADAIRDVQIGSTAPNFEIDKGLTLYQIPSDYTLLVFWSTWCSYCVEEVPQIKGIVSDYDAQLVTITVSLDTDYKAWKDFIQKHELNSFLNYSELKSWDSEVVRKYNIHATPSMLVLDKDKKIIAKPINLEQLRVALNSNLK